LGLFPQRPGVAQRQKSSKKCVTRFKTPYIFFKVLHNVFKVFDGGLTLGLFPQRWVCFFTLFENTLHIFKVLNNVSKVFDGVLTFVFVSAAAGRRADRSISVLPCFKTP
jgi:hypothetical protein